MAKKTNDKLSSPVLYIALGVLLAIFRSAIIDWGIYLVGLFFVISGIVDIVKKRTSSGVVNLVIGIVLMVLGGMFKKIVLIALGVMLIVRGALDLAAVLKRKKKNALMLVLPILTIVMGVALGFGGGLDTIILVVGILLIVDGVLGLVGNK